jgi:uncharacterized protein (DUF1330 family)
MNYGIGLSLMVAGGLIGAAVTHGLHAQGSAPAYSISSIEVIDQAKYAPIQQIIASENQKSGAKFLTRGGRVEAVEGTAPPRVIVSQWKSVDDAKKFYGSPTIKKAFEDRKPYVKNSLTYIVEGTVEPVK